MSWSFSDSSFFSNECWLLECSGWAMIVIHQAWTWFHDFTNIKNNEKSCASGLLALPLAPPALLPGLPRVFFRLQGGGDTHGCHTCWHDVGLLPRDLDQGGDRRLCDGFLWLKIVDYQFLATNSHKFGDNLQSQRSKIPKESKGHIQCLTWRQLRSYKWGMFGKDS